MNHDKTEYTEITRLNDRNKEEWRSTRKLGSLIGDDEDVLRRKQLATAAFRGLWNLWKRGQQVSEKLRLYQAFISPVLLYNSGTWAVTKSAQERLDSFHRRQLRSLIGIRWPQTISNNALYARCESQPISHTIKILRWKLFGHVLRLSDSTPAVQAMVSYYTSKDLKGWRGRPRTSLPGTLSADLEAADAGKLSSLEDLHRIRKIAVDRAEWRALCQRVTEKDL
ncbi:uncharacterized protein LOC135827165 [Sycon ciliatum]|uniref:uncharacterized protein LOC135827165 n=1 Tax=Sycon ciliatum TaxID=27933 RepID=UPI0031F71606